MKLKDIIRSGLELFRIKEGGHLVEAKEAPFFERSFLIPLSIVGIIFSAVSIAVNFLWSFTKDLQIFVFITLILYFIIYLLAKRGRRVNLAKWLLVTLTLIITNIAWYYDYRSAGPMLYLIFIFYGYLIFLLDNKKLILISVIIAIDISVLYFLESQNFIPPSSYPNAEMHLMDAYTATALYLMIIAVLMVAVKKNYLREYYKAIESDQLKTTFLANISHEIRTPLNAVIGFSNLMLTEEVTPEERSLYKTYINENNRYLLSLVNDILDISLIESNTVQIEEEPCNLNHMILELQKVYSLNLQKQGNSDVTIQYQVPQNDIYIDIDHSYLERVLKLLMDNAIKFTSHGSVLLGLSQEGKSIRFFVKDTGIGIKEEDKGFLFERFHKLEYNEQKVMPGTGVGLYLVKMIVEMFGGTVSFQSTYGEGSEFGFTIPAKKLRITTGTIPTEEK